MLRPLGPLCAALLGVCVLAAPASAQPTYTNRATFTALLNAPTTIGFGGVAAPGTAQSVGGGGIPWSHEGVDFDMPSLFSEFLVVDGAYLGGAYDIGGGASITFQDFGFGAPIENVVTFSRAGGFQAFGFDFLFGQIGTTEFSVLLDGVPLSGGVQRFLGAGPQFWGFIAPSAVNTVTITFGTDVVVLDDLTYGTASGSVVPEPGTTLLVATGLAGLVLVARRRRTR